MIKVLQLLYRADMGETEQNTQFLIHHTDKQKFNVSACFLHNDGPMVEIYRKSGITTTVIGMKHGIDVLGAIRYRQFLKKNNFDIIHIQTPNVLTLAISFFTVPHVICHICWAKARERKGLRKILLSFFFKRVDRIITPCDHVKNILISNYAMYPDQVQTVYNGIDIQKSAQTLPSKKTLLASFNINDDDAFVIGFVGNLIPIKGCHKLLHAAHEIINKDRHCYILIVGDGPERPGLKLLAHELNIQKNVVFTEAQDDLDIAKIFKAFDVFVLPSDAEAFPRVVEQAFAAGIPTISSNVGGIGEIIRDGVEGFLVNPGICDELKEKIAYLKNNKSVRKAMARAARERAKDFDIHKKTRQIEQLYEQILRSKAT